MRILQLCHGLPAATAVGGGPLYYWQALSALRELGHDIHLAVVDAERPAAEELEALASSITYLTTIAPSRRNVDYWLGRVFRAETLALRFPDWGGLRSQVETAIARIHPDLIWAEHISMMRLVPLGVPIVYSHHDFIHRLMKVRQASRRRLRRPDIITSTALAKIEYALAKRASVVVSVSRTEVDVFERHGVKAFYVPVVGAYVPRSAMPPTQVARAFLFGRSNTAMAMQRRNLRDDVWPHVRADDPVEWHQLGEVPSSRDDTWRWLEEHFRIHGFVEDLGSVLGPGDLCLIPYRDDTGFRVKLVTAAAHSMVNVGYVETFRCAPEFRAGETCVAAASAEELAEGVRALASDRAERLRIGSQARALYESRFTPRAQLPIYEQVLASV